MGVDFYHNTLFSLLLLCGGLIATSRNPKDITPIEELTTYRQKGDRTAPPEKKASQWSFYAVYALVMGADWLQGPFLYALYRDTHGLKTAAISSLFTAGFVAGAVSSSIVGSIADRHGRRLCCLSFCILASLSTLLTAFGGRYVALLTLGRILGGVGTSLLFSVFESWMVTDFKGKEMKAKGLDIERTFGWMAVVNSLAAIIAGLVAEWVVGWTGSNKGPFVTSVGALGLAAVLMKTQWDENYGEAIDLSKNSIPNTPTPLAAALANKHTQAVAITCTLFEGAMYLFIFFWGPALRATSAIPNKQLPYGIIFASFMASATAASLVLSRNREIALQTERPSVAPTGRDNDVDISKPGSHKVTTQGVSMDVAVEEQSGNILWILTAAAMTLGFAALSSRKPKSENRTFMLFCAYEAAVGIYNPCMSSLKNMVVPDEVRARVYSLMRIPVNVFVVVTMWYASTVTDVGAVFGVCAGCLALAAGSVAVLTAQ